VSTLVLESPGSIAERVAEVERRIGEACERAGRTAEDVRLVAATKDVGARGVESAWGAGVREFGENYAAKVSTKRQGAPHATWHFIGRLQRGTVKKVLESCDVVQTLEPGRAADRLARLAEERGRAADCLVEVDFTGGRVGVAPEEVEAFVETILAQGRLRILGLMTVPPLGAPPRPYFERLRTLRDRIADRDATVRELSMGMSGDYEEAVEEGATMVRIGTAIFGPRPGAVRGAPQEA
jgi:pyridoxal phosphate enzyme (YggS family)